MIFPKNSKLEVLIVTRIGTDKQVTICLVITVLAVKCKVTYVITEFDVSSNVK